MLCEGAVLRKETLMPYAARRGASAGAAIAGIGGLLLVLSAVGCSDSRDGGSPDGTGGSDGGGSEGGFNDTGGAKGDATSDAPPLPWKAVPVEGTVCRDGTSTGYGINVNPSSRNLLIFMEGGGACFNSISCLQNPDSWAPTDANLTSTRRARRATWRRARWSAPCLMRRSPTAR